MNRIIRAMEKGRVYSGYIISAGDMEKSLELAFAMAKIKGSVPYIIKEPNMENIRRLIAELYTDVRGESFAVIYGNKLSNACQNALLKTLEQPPSNSVIVFVTTNTGVFLPTVISRCVLYTCPNDENIDVGNEICNRFAFGSETKAQSLLEDDEFFNKRNKGMNILENLAKGLVLPYDKKADFEDYVFFIQLFFRDLVAKEPYYFFDAVNLVNLYKNNFTSRQILSIIKYINDRVTDLHKNTNKSLVFYGISAKIAEECK